MPRQKVTTATVREGRRFLERTRKHIQAAKLVDRLVDYCMGDLELTAGQIKAHLALINKVLPDVRQVDVKGTVQHQHVLTREAIEGELVSLGIDPALEWQRMRELPPNQ